MKITDILSIQDSILSGKPQFFIAQNDLMYNGLPILKDSLVFYDGKREISVNQINAGIFQESNVPSLICHQLPKDKKGNYFVDKVSLCQYEITELPSGRGLIWHNDHFHLMSSTVDRLPDVINTVNKGVELEYAGVFFSSLYYSFNVELNCLSVFISTKPFELKIKDIVIKLPGFIEVGQNEGSNKDFYYLRPLEKLEYFGISLNGDCRIEESGILFGDCSDEFQADIFGYSEINKITVTEGFEIMISHDGNKKIKLLNKKANKIEDYEIRECI
jgi:hypothetical protein